jgi:hypothetical protein
MKVHVALYILFPNVHSFAHSVTKMTQQAGGKTTGKDPSELEEVLTNPDVVKAIESEKKKAHKQSSEYMKGNQYGMEPPSDNPAANSARKRKRESYVRNTKL